MAIGWIRLCTHRGRDHHRQPLGEVAQHLERRRSRAEHDRGPQHRGRHAGAEQDLGHLGARAQVRGELLALGLQRAEVDQPADARLLCGPRHHLAPSAGRSPRSRARAEGVDQVVDDVRRRRRRRRPGRRRPRRPGRSPPGRTTGGRAAARGMRVITRTRWPAASSSGTSRPPMYPVAPVTRQVSGGGRRRDGRPCPECRPVPAAPRSSRGRAATAARSTSPANGGRSAAPSQSRGGPDGRDHRCTTNGPPTVSRPSSG